MPKYVEEMKGSPDPEDLSAAISDFLQIIEVKCEVVDEVVLNVLKFLRKLGISHCSHILYFCSLLSHGGKKASNEETSKFIWKRVNVGPPGRNVTL